MAGDDYAFSELVNLESVERLLVRFFKLTNLPPSITDVKGNVLLTVGFKKICSEFHRAHPITRARCVQSDIKLSKELSSDSGYACYECLNGLVDLAIPIVIDGTHIANLFIGQFFMDVPPDLEYFRNQAKQFGFHVEDYMKALDEIPVVQRDKVELAAQFLAELAEILGEMALNQKKLRQFNEELEATVKDRTRQLDMEAEERRKTLAEFETIFHNTTVAIVHIKGNRIVHNVNKHFEELFGYTREEAVGQHIEKIFLSKIHSDEFGMEYRPRLAAGEIIQAECQLKRKNGEVIWCSLCGRAVTLGKIEQGIIWIIDDITERKELEALKDDIERIMHHDLKVPLNGIVSLAQMLLLDDSLTPEQQEDIKLIEESGFRMNNQINQSLELYKIETGTYELHPIPMDMSTCIRKVVRDLSRKAYQKGIRFDVRVNDVDYSRVEPLYAEADPMLSHTLFSNLLDNAIEASPVESRVTISISENGSDIVTLLNNQGMVPEEIRKTFFDKYVTYGKTKGTGLGTYTAKLMAEAQNGKIAMETDKATGTTITVTLPK